MKNKAWIILSAFLAVFFAGCREKPDIIISLEDPWRFHTGDSLVWTDPAYDDSAWDSLDPKKLWEMQGYPNYDGFAWYRFRFMLPSEMLNNSYFKDSVQIILGEIDDTEETYLNGKLLGQNGQIIGSEGENAREKFFGSPDAYRIVRRYVISANDPRLHWDKENLIAIRVHDHGGGGGFYGQKLALSMVDVRDQLKIDVHSKPLKLLAKNTFSKEIRIISASTYFSSGGKLNIIVQEGESGRQVLDTVIQADIEPGKEFTALIQFKADQSIRHVIHAKYTDKKSKKTMHAQIDVPYILTPIPGPEPRINGAKVVGVRPGKPFLFYIPVSGERPIAYKASGLPAGLSLDASTGIITGKVSQKGEYKVAIQASNALGKAERELRIVVGDKLALTPPMGWNSWNCWGLSVDDQKVRDAVDHFVSSGLIDHGWTYVNIDDGWEAPERNKKGEIVPNEKFPDMKALTDYVHSKGMRMGIYSSPGPLTCGHYLGSYQHELQDAKSYAQWGIDYLKYDWCSYSEVARDNSLEELQKPYLLMKKCLDQTDRDIVYSLCQYGMGDVSKWGGQVGGNLWRTTGDIVDTWESMMGIGSDQARHSAYAKPGEWNDPDMLVVGWVGWGPSLHPTRLTASEQYTHISLWALLAAPLLIGCDLTRLDDFTLNLLTNDEVLAINQDPLGKQAIRMKENSSMQLWVKELEDGSKAIGLLNMSEQDAEMDLNFVDAGLAAGKYSLRDVWRQKDLGSFENSYKTKIPAHGVLLVKLN